MGGSSRRVGFGLISHGEASLAAFDVCFCRSLRAVQASEHSSARSRHWDWNIERYIEQVQDQATGVIITIESNELKVLIRSAVWRLEHPRMIGP